MTGTSGRPDLVSVQQLPNEPRTGFILKAGVAWWLTMLLISFVTLTLRIALPAESFADFLTYVEVAQDIAGSTFQSLWPLEPLSRGTLLFAERTLGSAETAALVAHWINSGVFLVGLALVTARYKNDWHGLLVVWGLYGALLGFVTLRATPAYFLVAYAVTRLINKPTQGALVITVAAGFHASALLMFIPWLFSTLTTKTTILARADGDTLGRVCFVLAGIACYLMVSGGIQSAELLVTLLSSNDATAKFSTYAEFAAAGENLQSLGHRAYFVLLTAIALVGALSKHAETRRIWPFVASAYVMTALAAASPVVSFRLSLFWTIPLLLSFPWSHWMVSSIRSAGVTVASLSLYIAGLLGVLAT